MSKHLPIWFSALLLPVLVACGESENMSGANEQSARREAFELAYRGMQNGTIKPPPLDQKSLGVWRVVQPQANGYELEYIPTDESSCREQTNSFRKGGLIATCESVDQIRVRRGGRKSVNWSWQ